MNSNWVGTGIERARSVTKITAPLSTVISSRSWPVSAAQVAIVVADFLAELGDAGLDLLLGEQHRLDVPRIQLHWLARG